MVLFTVYHSGLLITIFCVRIYIAIWNLLNELNMLKNVGNMPAKWQLLTSLGTADYTKYSEKPSISAYLFLDFWARGICPANQIFEEYFHFSRSVRVLFLQPCFSYLILRYLFLSLLFIKSKRNAPCLNNDCSSFKFLINLITMQICFWLLLYLLCTGVR